MGNTFWHCIALCVRHYVNLSVYVLTGVVNGCYGNVPRFFFPLFTLYFL